MWPPGWPWARGTAGHRGSYGLLRNGHPRHGHTSPARPAAPPALKLVFLPAASWSSMAPAGLLGVCGLLCAWGAAAAAAGQPCGLDHQVGTGAQGRCEGGGVPADCWSTAGLAGARLGRCAVGSRHCSAAATQPPVSSSTRP